MCTCKYTQLFWAREKTTVRLIELEHIKIEISAIDSRSDKKKRVENKHANETTKHTVHQNGLKQYEHDVKLQQR